MTAQINETNFPQDRKLDVTPEKVREIISNFNFLKEVCFWLLVCISGLTGLYFAQIRIQNLIGVGEEALRYACILGVIICIILAYISCGKYAYMPPDHQLVFKDVFYKFLIGCAKKLALVAKIIGITCIVAICAAGLFLKQFHYYIELWGAIISSPVLIYCAYRIQEHYERKIFI